MKIDARAFAVAAGLLWASAILIVSLLRLEWPSYGQAFLDLVASVYPGYSPARSIGKIALGTIFGLADAAVAGWILAIVYNRFARAS